MSAAELRDAMIVDLANATRKHGFRRRGRTLVRIHKNGNRSVVSLQSSQRLTKECVYIRPACGVCSVALHAAEWPDQKMFFMGEQVGKLLSSFLPGMDSRTDHWWKIADERDWRRVFDELHEVLESKAVPWMNEHWEDASILKCLQADLARGATGPARTIGERQVALLERIVGTEPCGASSGISD